MDTSPRRNTLRIPNGAAAVTTVFERGTPLRHSRATRCSMPGSDALRGSEEDQSWASRRRRRAKIRTPQRRRTRLVRAGRASREVSAGTGRHEAGSQPRPTSCPRLHRFGRSPGPPRPMGSRQGRPSGWTLRADQGAASSSPAAAIRDVARRRAEGWSGGLVDPHAGPGSADRSQRQGSWPTTGWPTRLRPWPASS